MCSCSVIHVSLYSCLFFLLPFIIYFTILWCFRLKRGVKIKENFCLTNNIFAFNVDTWNIYMIWTYATTSSTYVTDSFYKIGLLDCLYTSKNIFTPTKTNEHFLIFFCCCKRHYKNIQGPPIHENQHTKMRVYSSIYIIKSWEFTKVLRGCVRCNLFPPPRFTLTYIPIDFPCLLDLLVPALFCLCIILSMNNPVCE